MCRLFGMATGPCRAHATFWLLEAPDSLEEQSHRQPDGTGLGWFSEEGTPCVDKAPIAAFEDEAFARTARRVCSTSFVAHVRFASTGGLSPQNTHPFEQHGRLLAHNGVIGGLDALEAELGDYRSLVEGDTDSERFFALVTKHIDAAGGDVGEGIAAAAGWVATDIPIYAINVIVVQGPEVWALRYPEHNDLYILERSAGGPSGARRLDHSSASGRIRVRSGELSEEPAVVFATERMDDNPGWRNLEVGELVHVDARLQVESRIVLDQPPSHPLALAPHAAASQRPG
jgi:predicted glutamine amidotransferase